MISNLLPQLAIAIIANLGPLSFGLHLGWFPPLEKILEEPGTPLDHPLTKNEISWFAAIPTISILIGMPVFGWLLQKVTRRTTLLLATIPHVFVFAGYLITRNVPATMVLRFIAGFVSAGGLVACPVFINECVNIRLRGPLCGATAFFVNIGVAVACTVSGYCSYFILNIVCLSFPALIFTSLFWLPDSPVQLVSVGDEEGARKNLVVLRGKENVDDEMADITAAQEATQIYSGRSSCGAVFNDPATKRALFIMFGIMTMQQLSGISALCAYQVEIIKMISSVDSLLTAVIISILQLISSAIAPVMLSVSGRKTSLLASGWIMAVCLAIIAGYSLSTSLSAVPAMALAGYAIAYNFGLGSVPFVLLPELLAPHARGAAVAIIGSWTGLLCFLTTLLFHSFTKLITISGCFFAFSSASLLGTVFIHYCVFETRGLTAEEIYNKMQNQPVSNQESEASQQPIIKAIL